MILIMFGVVGVVSSYDFGHVNPDVLVMEGSPLKLMCSTDDHYEYCTYTSPKKQECHFEWKRRLNGIKKMACEDRIKFNGNYDNYQCGIKINKVTQENWGTCDLINSLSLNKNFECAVDY